MDQSLVHACHETEVVPRVNRRLLTTAGTFWLFAKPGWNRLRIWLSSTTAATAQELELQPSAPSGIK